MSIVRTLVGLAVVIGLTACGDTTSSEETSSTETTASSTDAAVRELEDGSLEPGRYRHVLEISCDDPPVPCPDGPPPPLGVDITVSDGWGATMEYATIHPAIPNGTDLNVAVAGPKGAGLVMAWATVWVGLHSDPCTPIGHPGGHQTPDIAVGPTIDDFADAVVAHPTLDVTEPTDVTIGGHDARFFTLTAPSNITSCENWRPWDPGIFAQGPENIWDVWAIDVDGFRVIMVAQQFESTPDEVRTELRQIVESMTFEWEPA